MNVTYFNFRETEAAGRWDRRTFFNVWWRFYESDPHWTPPYYPLLRRTLTPPYDPYLQRRDPRLFYLEAVSRPEGAEQPDRPLPVSAWERPVAAAVTLRAKGGAVHLALPRCANDKGTLRQLLERAVEGGGGTLIGPTHLSPYLGAGALDSHWNLRPPLHTPYNPPYFCDLLRSVMEPATRSRLYTLEVTPQAPPSDAAGPASLVPLEPVRLADDLLPLLEAACAPWQAFAPPDAAEARFLLGWLAQWPLRGWLALMDGKPAGFVLLQADGAAAMQQAGGGKALWRRLWLRWAVSRGASAGRLLFGAVLPAWRGQGVGAQMLAAARETAAEAGWQALTIGPLPEGAPAAGFLEAHGARPQQAYQLYRWQAPAGGRPVGGHWLS